MANVSKPDVPRNPNAPDALADFERRELTLLGTTRLVYVAGTGPAVIVMSEMPGIYPLVARFARWVRDAGFTVWMPHLFGVDGKPLSMAYGISSMIRGCISREFRAFAANASSPVVDWLRALAAHAYPLSGGKGVGAIGMCFTGNFALSLMLEPTVRAPVLCQPSMPVDECARQIARAIERRDRELVMTAAGKAGAWLKLVAPALLDRLVERAVRRFDEG